jgi:elongation factor P--beta-lysine ligase
MVDQIQLIWDLSIPPKSEQRNPFQTTASHCVAARVETKPHYSFRDWVGFVTSSSVNPVLGAGVQVIVGNYPIRLRRMVEFPI